MILANIRVNLIYLSENIQPSSLGFCTFTNFEILPLCFASSSPPPPHPQEKLVLIVSLNMTWKSAKVW